MRGHCWTTDLFFITQLTSILEGQPPQNNRLNFKSKQETPLERVPGMYTVSWNPKQPFINGCFNWMIPNLYIVNGCFTKHLFINGCLEFQDLGVPGMYTVFRWRFQSWSKWDVFFVGPDMAPVGWDYVFLKWCSIVLVSSSNCMAYTPENKHGYPKWWFGKGNSLQTWQFLDIFGIYVRFLACR